MSEEPDRFGYGIDIGLKFSLEGEIDLDVDDSGDIAIVGGDGTEDITIKAQNAMQQIRIRLQTPFESLKDEEGNALSIGSQLAELVGKKKTDTSVMLLKSFIIAAISDLQFIQSILDIRLFADRIKNPTTLKTQIFFTLKEDTDIYYTSVDLINVV
jgi:hypothetical protein